MGIKGAALATVVSTAVQMVWCIAYAAMKMGLLQIHLPGNNRDLGKRFWEKTAPVLLNELVWGGGFTMYSVIMGHMGTDAVAANSIANISKNLVVCLCIGLGSAGSIIIGNELGADNFTEAKRVGRVLTMASIICGLLSGMVLLALSPVIMKFVSLTPTAKNYLKNMLLICSYYLVGKSVNSMTIGGIFPAGGDSKFGLVTIGENSVIGAGSVVTKDIPANVIAFGSPCKVYREINEQDEEYYFKDRRFDEQPE